MKANLITVIICITFSTVIYSQKNDSINFFIQNYQYVKALELIETENEITDEILMTKAYLCRNLHKYNDAIEIYKLVFQNDTNNIKVMIDMSNCYEAINDYETAQSLIKSALVTDSANIFLIQKLGDSYYQSRNFLQSVNTYLQAEKIDSSYYLAKQLARSYENLKSDSMAIIYYYKTLNFNPKDYRSLLRLVDILRVNKDFDTALALTENYLMSDSLNTQVLRMNGVLNYSKNRLPSAIISLQKCLDLKDSSDIVIKFMGYSLFKTQYYDESKPFLDYLCKIEPNNPEVFYMAGMAHTRSSTPDIGLIYMEVALDILTAFDSTFMSTFYYDLGVTRSKNYQFRQAIKDYETALLYNPNNYFILHEIAIIYSHNLKNRKKAIEYFKRFLHSSDTEHDTNNEYSKLMRKYVESTVQRLEEEEFMERGK